MMLNNDIREYIERSVLCWLATVDETAAPNVSPKEIFTYFDDHTLLIANIASPTSVKNIKTNPNICVGFVDVFVQKGYKLKGTAKIIEANDASFAPKMERLSKLVDEQLPIESVIEVNVTKVDKIIAPSYFLFSNTTEATQIMRAMKNYGVTPN